MTSPNDIVGNSSPTSVQVGQHLLMREHGPIIGCPTLWRLLGYGSADAFRKAVQRKTLPIATFSISHRRGRFAQTADVIRWLDAVASSPPAVIKGKEV